MEYTPWIFLTDLGLILILILAGKLLRVKLKLFQRLFIPASITAGLLGLLLGPSVLGVVPFSDQIATYPEILIAVVFAALPLGQSFDVRGIAGRRIGALWSYTQAVYAMMWGFGLLVSLAVLGLIWDLPRGFGLMLASGFVGGHGSAAAIGTTFQDVGWREAQSLAFTSATVGVLVAIVGGLALIKWGTRTGRANVLPDFRELPDDLRTGLVPEERRRSVGQGTISPISLEPLAFHLGLIVAVTLVAYYLGGALGAFLGDFTIPTFAMAFLVGLLVQFALVRTGANEYVDRATVNGITGTATDLLIAFGIASIVPTIVADYLAPLTILFLLGIAYCFILFRYLAPVVFDEYAFEKGIFTWGWSTGAVAQGIALLRIADPERESQTLEDYSIAYVPNAPVEVAIVTFAPVLVISGYSWWLAAGTLAIGGLALAFARLMGWWGPTKTSRGST